MDLDCEYYFVDGIFITIKCSLVLSIIFFAISLRELHYASIIFIGLVVVLILCHFIHSKVCQIYEIQRAQRDAEIQPRPSDQNLSIQIDDRVQLQPLRAERREHSERSPQFMNTALPARVIASLLVLPPTKSFESTESSSGQTKGSKDECAICLEDFKNGESVQPFPKCNHVFHPTCINTWLLAGKFSCPYCRVNLQELGV
ncbi:hypothetical protein L6164_023572 [Bauhinia variegata]|uniref:Uncharacterized protein n=1 Tax=Bauhinia variegata TaxID=167791 RepID=A0ACB9MNQ0_BAUVA|nr:hypothetical protein L6164_023572 [Bauhinia variegata]